MVFHTRGPGPNLDRVKFFPRDIGRLSNPSARRCGLPKLLALGNGPRRE